MPNSRNCRNVALWGCLSLMLLASCAKDHCHTSIGATNFYVEPNSATHAGLNNVGGYEFLTGGHRGVVVVRTAYDDFVAYDRTCPEDNTTKVDFASGWEGTILECPVCHTRFNVYADGAPLDGGKTVCPLYEYGTTYDGYRLYVY